MQTKLQIGEETLTAEALIPLIKRYRLLPQLRRDILIDRAIANVQLTPEEAAKAQQQFDIQHNLFSEDTRQIFCDYTGFSLEDVEDLATRPAKLAKFKQEEWGTQLGTYFLKRKNHLDRVIYSMIRTENSSLAQELFFRLQNNEETFPNLAKLYSEGPEAKLGGLVGPVALGTLNAELARLLSISQPGQLWPVSQLGKYFVIIRFEEHIPAEYDERMKQQLLNECFERWLTEQTDVRYLS